MQRRGNGTKQKHGKAKKKKKKKKAPKPTKSNKNMPRSEWLQNSQTSGLRDPRPFSKYFLWKDCLCLAERIVAHRNVRCCVENRPCQNESTGARCLGSPKECSRARTPGSHPSPAVPPIVGLSAKGKGRGGAGGRVTKPQRVWGESGMLKHR